jgi:hypothetical protein
MTWLAGIRAVAGFQCRRLRTPPRLLLAVAGAAFPAAVMLAVRRIAGPLDTDVAALLLHMLVPEAVCMLGLLVTMCPCVADELERGTWPHVCTRPGGRRALLLGTYVAAVAWTFAVSLAALAGTLAAARVAEPGRLAAVIAPLALLSCLGRAALFALPAVLVPKRALVASVAAALVVEYLAGFLPAIINQFTVSLRLRSLLVSWMGWRDKLPVELELLIDSRPAWVQVAFLGLLAAALLGAAAVILERRQFPPAEEQ